MAEAGPDIEDITSPVAPPLIHQSGLLNADLSSSRILDLGAGMGQITKAIHNLINKASIAPPLEVVCGEVDNGLLEVLEEYKQSQSLANVTVKALNTNYSPSGYFQYIFANFVFFLLPQPEVALKEAYDSLAAGGTLAFSTWAYSGGLHLCQLAQANLLDSPPAPAHAQFVKWGNPGFIRQTLEEAGYIDIKIEIFNFRTTRKSALEVAKTMVVMVKMYTMTWGAEREAKGWELLKEVEKAMEREREISIPSVALLVTAKRA